MKKKSFFSFTEIATTTTAASRWLKRFFLSGFIHTVRKEHTIMTSALQSIPFCASTEEDADNGTIVTTHSSITVRMSNVTRAPEPGMQERVIQAILSLSPEIFLADSRDHQRTIVDFHINVILQQHGSQRFPEMTAERRHTIANKVVDKLRTMRNNAEAPVNNPAVGTPRNNAEAPANNPTAGPHDNIAAEDNSDSSLSTITDADRSGESRHGASNAGSRDTSTLQGEGIVIPSENSSLTYSADGANDSRTVSSNVESASGHGSETSNDESTSYGQQGDAPPKKE